MDINQLIRRLARTSIVGLTLMIALAASSLSTASASPPAPPSPHTIVSDTGQVIPAATGLAPMDGTRQFGSAAVAPFNGGGTAAPEGKPATPEGGESLGRREVPPAARAGEQGQVGPDSLYVDTRYRIARPASFPNSAVALVIMSNGGLNYRCSGFLIGRNTVVTAGHCVFFYGRWVTNVRVYPGYTGTYAPYGSCTASRLYSVFGWTRDHNSDYDYGAIKLNCTVGYRTGWLGYRWTSASLDSLFVRTGGYPADKFYQQWGSDGRVTYSAARKLRYTNFTTPGFNGAPVFDGGLYAVAIHTNASPWGASWGTRITSEVFRNLQYWSSL